MNDLYESLLERMEGKPYMGYFSALCPFHDDGRPSLLVNERNFRCTSARCGEHGSLEKLAKKIGVNYTPKKVVMVTPNFRNWMARGETVSEIASSAHRFLLSHPDRQKYLKRREMDKFIKAGMIGFKDGWLTFPVKNENGGVVDLVCRYLRGDGKAKYVLMGASECAPLYVPSWKMVHEQEIIYVPFGILDSWTFYALGLASVTYAAGKSTNAELLRPLRKEYKVVPDKGEERDAYRLVNNLGWRGDVLRVDWPQGTKDLQDVREKFGNQKTLQLITGG